MLCVKGNEMIVRKYNVRSMLPISLMLMPALVWGCCSGSSIPLGFTAQEKNRLALDNIHKLGTALLEYSQDYDEVFPVGLTIAQVNPALYPYLKDSSVFTDPITDKAFAWNGWLSGKSLTLLENPSQTVSFYEADDSTASARPVVKADGSYKVVNDTEWQLLKASSHIP